MKPGSVIVDLAASTGGNCDLTKNGEVFTTDNGVTIVGKLNQLPNQASQLYGNNLCHLLDDMGKDEKWKIDMEDAIVSRAMVTYDGKINWPPQPLPVSPPKAKVTVVEVEDPKEVAARKNKKEATSMIIKLSVIGLFLLEIVNTIYIQPLNVSSTNVMMVESVLLVFLSLVLFLKILKSPSQGNLL